MESYIVKPWVEVITFTSSAINVLIYWNSEFRRAFPCTFPWLPCPHRSKKMHRTLVDNQSEIRLNETLVVVTQQLRRQNFEDNSSEKVLQLYQSDAPHKQFISSGSLNFLQASLTEFTFLVNVNLSTKKICLFRHIRKVFHHM